jgi:uncharacterized protein (UPF0333 family)
MISEIIEFIVAIPAMMEFIIGAVIYLIISSVANEVIRDVAHETVCQSTDLASQILCFYATNPLVAFIVTVLSIIGIGLAFRFSFL